MNRFETNLINKMSTELAQKMETIFIDGLQLKGYSFDNKKDLVEFVALNCRSEDFPHKYEKIYFVKNIPFLLHCYKSDFPDISNHFDGNILSINYGSFAFL